MTVAAALRTLLGLCALITPSLVAAEGIVDVDRSEKFQQLEEKYADSPEYLDLTRANWLTNRGNTHGRNKEMQQAIVDFKDAIEIKQDYFPAYLSMALAYKEMGEYDKAIMTLDEAPTDMNMEGNDLGGFEYDIYYVRLLVYNEMPDDERALQTARTALDVLQRPQIVDERRQAEEFGLVATGSGESIIEYMKTFVQAHQ